MGSLVKLSEAIAVAEKKKRKLQEIMRVIMFGLEDVECNFKMIHESFGGSFAELKSKEKHLMGVQKSLNQRCEEFDLKRRSVEEGLKKLDEKEQFLKGILQEIEGEKLQYGKMRESVDEQLKEVALKEQKFEGLLGVLQLVHCQVERRKKELDITEEMFRRRAGEIDAREKMLAVREKKADSKARILVEKEKMINTREKELKILEKELEVHQRVLDLKNLIQEAQPVRGNRRKRSLVGDKFSGRDKALSLEKTIGSNNKSQAKSKQHLVVIDDSGSDSDPVSNLAANTVGYPSSSFSNSPSQGKLARKFNAGETWACFDRKDKMPRSYYALVTNVIDKDAKVVEVTWLKPCPVYQGEKEWINAGFPVACGKFEPGITCVESPAIFSHPVLRDSESYIVPCAGETWAIYKDWDISLWVSQPEIHSKFEYEIVEILSYCRGGGASSLGVRVAYLDRINGTVNSFQRRNKNDKDLSLIKRNCLYRFSHRLPSLRKPGCDTNGMLTCIFELDLKSLVLGV